LRKHCSTAELCWLPKASATVPALVLTVKVERRRNGVLFWKHGRNPATSTTVPTNPKGIAASDHAAPATGAPHSRQNMRQQKQNQFSLEICGSIFCEQDKGWNFSSFDNCSLSRLSYSAANLLTMGLNIFEPKTKFKRSPSAHQKQMRFWTISLVVLAIVVFAVVFYLLNKQSSRVAL
jgi:hypothetical protein